MRLSLSILAAFAGGIGSAGAACTIRGETSPWSSLPVAGVPEGVTVEWRKETAKAFDECLTDIRIRISNSGTRTASVTLRRCRVGAEVATGPSATLPPGGHAIDMLALQSKVPQDVSGVSCSVGSGNDPSPALLRPVKPGEAEAERSRQLVRHYLAAAFRSQADLPVKASDRIQSALAQVTNLREEPGMSGNIQLRNAEYYLHGLYAGVARDPGHLAATALAPLYVQVKALAAGVGLEAWLRSNPANPTSEPGGADWAFGGLRDALDIRDEAVKGSRDGFPYDLATLRARPAPR